jgi:hypothetical protein
MAIEDLLRCLVHPPRADHGRRTRSGGTRPGIDPELVTAGWVDDEEAIPSVVEIHGGLQRGDHHAVARAGGPDHPVRTESTRELVEEVAVRGAEHAERRAARDDGPDVLTAVATQAQGIAHGARVGQDAQLAGRSGQEAQRSQPHRPGARLADRLGVSDAGAEVYVSGPRRGGSLVADDRVRGRIGARGEHEPEDREPPRRDVAHARCYPPPGPSGCSKSTFLACLNRLTDLVPGCRVAGSIKGRPNEPCSARRVIDPGGEQRAGRQEALAD